jgi:hypothetical protein
MVDPFAEEHTPWWRRQTLWKRKPQDTPKRVARVLAVSGGFVVWALPHHRSMVVAILAGAVVAVPGALVERWYKQRHRQREEQLLVLPDGR